MDIFSVITLAGGLAFFLYGMHVMSSGLEKTAGGKLEKILRKMTSTPLKGLLLGIGITAAIQSSSAVTVILVGLVNSGIMKLSQSIGVIMGSNIGTTVTAWLLSLIGIESSNPFIKLLKPENFSLILAFIGIIMIMVCKSQRKKDIGSILAGFSILMIGMKFMSSAVAPLSEMPGFTGILTYFTNPLLGVLVGTIFTAVIQSSSASVGILQALSLTGSISYGVAIPIIMGQNIGTCVTSLISSVGVNKNAKRVAAVHISFNVIGTMICLAVYFFLTSIIHFEFLSTMIGPAGIAVCHSIFNVATTAMLFPFSKQLEKLAKKLIPDKEGDVEYTFIDDRLLATPSFAISECRHMTSKMAQNARDTLILSCGTITAFDKKVSERILENEAMLDMYEDKLGTCLVKLSSKDLSESDSKTVSLLLHTIGDFERIGDHAVNLMRTSQEISEKKISFSAEAMAELETLTSAINEILVTTIDAFTKNDLHLASNVEPLEQVIDNLTNEIKSRHVERLQSGACTIELGFILSDILTNFERVSDHCSNIAVALIEVAQNSFDTHEYLETVKTMENRDFMESYNEYKLKYKLSGK